MAHMAVERASTQAVTSNGAANGICNQYLPNDSVYKRFLYFISALAHNGFYIAIDNHVVYDTSYQNPTQWAAMWAQVTVPTQASICLPTILCLEEQEVGHPATSYCHVLLHRQGAAAFCALMVRVVGKGGGHHVHFAVLCLPQ